MTNKEIFILNFQRESRFKGRKVIFAQYLHRVYADRPDQVQIVEKDSYIEIKTIPELSEEIIHRYYNFIIHKMGN